MFRSNSDNRVKVVNNVKNTFKMCCRRGSFECINTVRAQNVESCGLRKTASRYVVGGHDFKHGDFPWIVALLRKTESGAEYFGGGTTISSQHVLTGNEYFKK